MVCEWVPRGCCCSLCVVSPVAWQRHLLLAGHHDCVRPNATTKLGIIGNAAGQSRIVAIPVLQPALVAPSQSSPSNGAALAEVYLLRLCMDLPIAQPPYSTLLVAQAHETPKVWMLVAAVRIV